jgi:hypothetical protein
MTPRAVIRHVPYEIREDPSAEHEYEARCVWGDEIECEASSGPQKEPGDVYKWQSEHTGATQHTRYRMSEAHYEVWEPTEPVPAPKPVPPKLEPAKVNRIDSCGKQFPPP